MLISLRLAKSGYYGGDPENVLNANANHVMTIVEYEGYQVEFERAYIKLNEEDK